jgi:hypothetical protein
MFWITALLGIVLAVAPFVFGYSANPVAMWTSIGLGAIVALVSILGLVQTNESDHNVDYWILAVVGLLAIIAPFALGYSTIVAALWITIALGVVLLLWDGFQIWQHRPAPRGG